MRIELDASTSTAALGPTSGRLYRLISQNIVNGRWPSGTRLPPARTLAQELNVSRDTLRRAFRSLEVAGLVECRNRSGIYIKPQPPSAIEQRRAATSQICVGTGLLDGVVEIEARRWTDQILSAAGSSLAADSMDMLVLSPMNTEPTSAREFFRRLDRQRDRVAGVLLMQPSMYRDLCDGLKERGLRCVVVNRPNLSARYNFVTADHLAAGRTLGRCLAKMNFRRIGLLGFQARKWPSSAEFWTGLIEGQLQTLGRQIFQFQLIECASSDEAEGYATVRRSLRRGRRPEIIIAAGDFQALGAIRACTEMGLKVPRDIAIVGTTGLDIGRFSSPRLTVLAQPMTRIGRTAAGMLLRMQRTGQSRIPGRALKCTFVLRDSLVVPPDVLQWLRTQDDLPILVQ